MPASSFLSCEGSFGTLESRGAGKKEIIEVKLWKTFGKLHYFTRSLVVRKHSDDIRHTNARLFGVRPTLNPLALGNLLPVNRDVPERLVWPCSVAPSKPSDVVNSVAPSYIELVATDKNNPFHSKTARFPVLPRRRISASKQST
jgi:hypothetical protein